jgi:hypothetical protein
MEYDNALSKFENIRINYMKERKEIFKDVESIVYNNDGIVYGEYVRDHIISTHYIKKYLNHWDCKHQSFWDETVLPQSKDRLAGSDTMDIFFKNPNDYHTFIEKLHKGFKKCEIEKSYSIYINEDDNALNLYVRDITMTFVFGETYTQPGVSFSVKIKIYFPVNCDLYYKNDPIYNLDMLCNGFIKSRNSITFSRNTGTPLDKVGDIELNIAIAKIQQYMICSKTFLCKKFKNMDVDDYNYSYNNEYIDYYNKIEKMATKWRFINIPYKVATFKVDEHDECDTCCICQEPFKKEDLIASVFNKNNKGSKTHKTCLEVYIKKQIADYNFNNIVCPYRYKIDIFGTYKTINYKKLTSLRL